MQGACRNIYSIALLMGLVVSLSACSSMDDDAKVKLASNDRIAVLDLHRQSFTVPTAADVAIELPEPAARPDWPQVGGMTTHSVGHVVLSSSPSVQWREDIGNGADSTYKLLAQPIIAQDIVFTMDARGMVTAYRASNGAELWERETTPENSDYDAMGGGIAYDKAVLYATTGFGEVIALNAQNGSVLWRRSLGKPLRSAPTISDNRLFVISIENETFALDARTSLVLWQHSGIAENATLMGSSSPAVNGDTVVVAYSSGEVFGLRAQNGRVVWGDVLAMPRRIGALPAIADIRGLPVIDAGRVYAVSHSGRMVALEERRGDRVWGADVGSMNTPAVSGNVVYVVSLDNELVAIERTTGKIIWNEILQSREDLSDRESDPVMWWGPVLASGQLWLTNSMGSVMAYDALSGKEVYKNEELEDSFSLPPVIAGKTLYVLSDDGDLVALK